MFQFSKKTKYAMQALLELSRIGNGGLVKRKELSVGCKIPNAFLEGVLLQLKNAGWIQTIRGGNGGIQLKINLSSASIYDLLQVVETREVLDRSSMSEENKIDQRIIFPMVQRIQYQEDEYFKKIKLSSLAVQKHETDYII